MVQLSKGSGNVVSGEIWLYEHQVVVKKNKQVGPSCSPTSSAPVCCRLCGHFGCAVALCAPPFTVLYTSGSCGVFAPRTVHSFRDLRVVWEQGAVQREGGEGSLGWGPRV